MTAWALTFSIPGEPKGKGRPRFTRRGPFVRTYTPDDTLSYENLVKHCAQMQLRNAAPFLGPVRMQVIAHFSIPASFSNKKKELARAGILRPAKKPDHDNILKIVSDALNGIAWRDDAQIVSSTFDKIYSETPRVEIRCGEFIGESRIL